VCGLTTAICLAESGLRVDIQAERPPLGTTSVAAGAIWGPFLVGPPGRVGEWGRRTLGILSQLAGEPGTGVRMVSGIEASRTQAGPPDWAGSLAECRPCTAGELPEGFAVGWRFTAPVATMPAYLGYLLDRFMASGGQLRISPVASLADASLPAPVIVNCTGIGSRDLVPDPAVVPVRGQVVVVTNPGISEFFIDGTGISAEFPYLFPHGDTVLLGGTAEPGNWSTRPDPATAARIIRGCIAVEPRLRGAQVVGHRVGLRPARPEVRLEAERRDGGLLLHNYGHGGAGVSLSWGCAMDITERVRGDS
jgi:D-amino-acid oxidase